MFTGSSVLLVIVLLCNSDYEKNENMLKKGWGEGERTGGKRKEKEKTIDLAAVLNHWQHKHGLQLRIPWR